VVVGPLVLVLLLMVVLQAVTRQQQAAWWRLCWTFSVTRCVLVSERCNGTESVNVSDDALAPLRRCPSKTKWPMRWR
jgi:hypothetical protein